MTTHSSSSVLGDPEDRAWMADAPCASADPDAWFPELGSSAVLAKRVCDGCPVRLQCLRFALDHDEQHGVWGGLSYMDRRKLRAGRPVTERVRLLVEGLGEPQAEAS